MIRRGWDAVEVHGGHEFRHAVSLRLGLIDPAVIVVDNPLAEADQIMLERMRQAAPANSRSGMCSKTTAGPDRQ